MQSVTRLHDPSVGRKSVNGQRKVTNARVVRSLDTLARLVLPFCGSVVGGFAAPAGPWLIPTNIFAPVSTRAQSIFDLSRFVLMVTASIFVVVFGLLAYAVVKFRKKRISDGREPARVYGSTQVELARSSRPPRVVIASIQ